jgi:hypothetical protein
MAHRVQAMKPASVVTIVFLSALSSVCYAVINPDYYHHQQRYQQDFDPKYQVPYELAPLFRSAVWSRIMFCTAGEFVSRVTP